MKILLKILFLLSLMSALLESQIVTAEQEMCPPEMNCELSMSKKINSSFSDAVVVAKGKFSKIGQEAYSFSDGLGLVDVTFTVEEFFKGNVESKSLNLKIPVYIQPLTSDKEKSKARLVSVLNMDSVLKKLSSFEESLEKGELNKKQYDKNRADYIRKLQAESQVQVKSFIAPVKPGGQDSSHRDADVPVSQDQEYIVFILQSVSDKGVAVLLSGTLDIYPVDGRADVEKVLASGLH